MLAKSDTDITSTLQRFARKNIDVALLVPTKTGLEKSIMDATAPVRSLLEDSGLHDYNAQPQGPANKKVLRAEFLTPDSAVQLDATLYRPETKRGDPRIWFSKLNKHAHPNNLLALFVHSGKLHVVNCSDGAAMAAIDDAGTPLGRIASVRASTISAEATELLDLLRGISARGFVRSIRRGDTGVGFTLETLLGIRANARKTPDYKGIEIKAARARRSARDRVTLFSQVPDWKLSPIGNARNLLNAIGYRRNGRLQYYQTISARVPNAQGLVLNLDSAKDLLRQDRRASSELEAMAAWQLAVLRARLVEKHAQTFWVKAEAKLDDGVETFHYTHVVHTRGPLVQNFESLIDIGDITLDYTLRVRPSGGVKDHGYLFKIGTEKINALFPPPLEFALC